MAFAKWSAVPRRDTTGTLILKGRCNTLKILASPTELGATCIFNGLRLQTRITALLKLKGFYRDLQPRKPRYDRVWHPPRHTGEPYRGSGGAPACILGRSTPLAHAGDRIA